MKMSNHVQKRKPIAEIHRRNINKTIYKFLDFLILLVFCVYLESIGGVQAIAIGLWVVLWNYIDGVIRSHW